MNEDGLQERSGPDYDGVGSSIGVDDGTSPLVPAITAVNGDISRQVSGSLAAPELSEADIVKLALSAAEDAIKETNGTLSAGLDAVDEVERRFGRTLPVNVRAKVVFLSKKLRAINRLAAFLPEKLSRELIDAGKAQFDSRGYITDLDLRQVKNFSLERVCAIATLKTLHLETLTIGASFDSHGQSIGIDTDLFSSLRQLESLKIDHLMCSQVAQHDFLVAIGNISQSGGTGSLRTLEVGKTTIITAPVIRS